MATYFEIKKDFKEFPAILYAINLYKTSLSSNDIESIRNKLKRCKLKYPYISYLLIVSNTDSSYCARRKLMLKNKRGRPKEIVLGNKIEPHIHLSIIGDSEHSAFKCIKEIQSTINKRFGEKICGYESKGHSTWAKNFVNYSLKQANSINKSGIFNEILEKREVIDTYYL